MTRHLAIGSLLLLLAMVPSGSGLAAELPLVALQYNPQISTGTGVEGGYRLVNLNPNLGHWYLLERDYLGEGQFAHLEVPSGKAIRLRLEGQALVIDGINRTAKCSLEGESNPLFIKSTQAFTASCSADVFVRHDTGGYISTGEFLTQLSKHWQWSQSLFLNLMVRVFNRPEVFAAATPNPNPPLAKPAVSGDPSNDASPIPARLKPDYEPAPISASQLGLRLEAGSPPRHGSWGRVQSPDGEPIAAVYASVITPEISASSIKIPDSDKANLVYLLGFDLSRTRLDYHLGASEPGLGWSRVTARTSADYGPDGFAHIAPLRRNGIVPFWQVRNLLAVFSGGMGRDRNNYNPPTPAASAKPERIFGGITQSGVLLSRLQPGLATVYGLSDGRIGIKAWQESDQSSLGPLSQFALQNGFMILDDGAVAPMVWKRSGNWNGNDQWPRSQVRSGLCLQKSGGKEFLLYGLFTGATPVTMAKVFLSYGCTQAMQLDSGSYATSFAELFTWDQNGGAAQALAPQAKGWSRNKRFISQSDSRDFFTVTVR
ncbi:MAG: hypothetical protein ORO03_09070 [Alphaproteobacteria bacterium]|nr:hypothetical protein [Alphaproteobacteria bacterium]